MRSTSAIGIAQPKVEGVLAQTTTSVFVTLSDQGLYNDTRGKVSQIPDKAEPEPTFVFGKIVNASSRSQRPGETWAAFLKVKDWTSSYSSVQNLLQHLSR